MLKAPEETSGVPKQAEIPCFRCLFEKPIDEGKCVPEKCDMIDFWLNDPNFSWTKYYFKFMLRLQQENSKNNGSFAEE